MTLLKMPQKAIPLKEEWSTERKQHPNLGEDGEGNQVHGFLSLTEEEALLVTAAVSIALGTDAAVVAGMMLEVVTLGVGMLRVTPTASQICCAKARVTKKRGDRQRRTCVLPGFGVEEGRGGLPCWSAAEQTVSIRLCSEVTNLESPQMQAKSDSAQPVAEMPASAADCWR